MICLTADIHHSSLRTGNQKHSDVSEAKLAKRFAQMLNEARVSATFFVSGKTFEDEYEDIRYFTESELFEIGGHNYNCFTPEIFHRISKKIFNSYNRINTVHFSTFEHFFIINKNLTCHNHGLSFRTTFRKFFINQK